jgi:acetolactate synthase-1/2/3 large subunit
MTAQLELLEALRDAVPGAIMVGDSTQVIYAGNLYYDHDRPAGWFNAATGYGALGFSIPAAIGACFACPDAYVLCLCGDGGAQFTLPELMTAVDENLPIRFLIWNNHAYGEIASSMEAAGVEVVGCHPTPPDFEHIARACGMPFRRVAMKPGEVVGALRDLQAIAGPAMIEITMPS